MDGLPVVTPGFLGAWAFVWGCIWGSFLNVVIHRLPRGQNLAKPRSSCPSCGHMIVWFENVPLLSWIALRGKCRKCKTSISPRYFLVEGLTGVLSLGLFLKLYGSLLDPSAAEFILPFMFFFVFICAVISIAFIDLELTVIPDALTLPTLVLGIVAAFVVGDGEAYAFLHPNPTLLDSVIGAVAGFGFLFSVFLGYRLVTGRIGMGGGDFTMVGMIGAFLGWQSLPFVFFFASTQGLVFAVGAAIYEKLAPGNEVLLRGVHKPEYWEDPSPGEELEGSSESGSSDALLTAENDGFGKLGIPFGPFLGLAAIEYIFFGGWAQRILLGS